MDRKAKLQVKDLITLGVLNAVFIVIFSVIGIVLGMFPVTYLIMPAIVAVPLGVVFMLLLTKVAKTGTFFISGILQGTVLLILGVYWPVVTAVVSAALLGEFIVQGKYSRFKRIAAGYAVFICGYSLGSFAPLVFFAEAYRAMAVSRGYDAGYINKLIELLNGPVLLGILAMSALGALLGALLGKRIMSKHFAKAGIV